LELSVRAVVVGIPGVGKTTVVEGAKKAVAGSKTVVFGTVMLEEGLRLKWIENRDQLRRMPVVKQRRLQEAAARKISKMKGTVLFIDTHLFIRTSEGLWPGLPFDVLRALKPTHIILVEAPAESVLSRRQKDTTRYRDAATIEDLQTELNTARQFLSAASLVSGAPFLMVKNEEGKIEEAVQRVVVAVGGASK
jgi:adenylate kinase